MFTLKSEPSNLFSRIILSQATFGVFGVVVLIAMLFFAFVGNVAEEDKLFGKLQSAKAVESKPSPEAVAAKNLAKLGR